MTFDAALERITREFQEMPDLKLTVPQIRRLCDLPEELCAGAIEALVDTGFLRKVADGQVLCSPKTILR
jgi:hypothetical protein